MYFVQLSSSPANLKEWARTILALSRDSARGHRHRSCERGKKAEKLCTRTMSANKGRASGLILNVHRVQNGVFSITASAPGLFKYHRLGWAIEAQKNCLWCQWCVLLSRVVPPKLEALTPSSQHTLLPVTITECREREQGYDYP
jgi:hypothetical protein